MQAISVKYIPPTNSRGARWRVRADAFSYLIPYNYTHTNERRAWEACALALARFDAECLKTFGRTGWRSDWIGGQTHDGGYVFVPLAGTRNAPSGVEGAYRYDGAQDAKVVQS